MRGRRTEKRGRGTAKDAVLRAVERGGEVVAQLVPNVTGQTILKFIKSVVKTEDSELITDQYRDYNAIDKEMKHETLNRSENGKKVRYIPIPLKASGHSSKGHGMDNITTIRQDTRPCFSQRRAINITTEKLTYSGSF